MKHILTLGLAALFALPVHASALSDLFDGKYKVVNKDCLKTGNPYRSPATIEVSGSDLVLKVEGPKPFTLKFFEGEQSDDRDGKQYKKSGVAFGNGFAYSESVRQGRRILSQVDYTFTWEDGKLTLKKRTRLNARHAEVAYCDLAPAK